MIDRAGIAQLAGMTWRQARRARPWAAVGHPSPITTGRPTHGRPQLWDYDQAEAFAQGRAIPALPSSTHARDLLDRFAAAHAADVNPVTWASDMYDHRVPPPDTTIYDTPWWYRDTVERYRAQRAQPRPATQPVGRPAGRTEPIARSRIRAEVAALLTDAEDAGHTLSTAEVARRLGIHYTTALRHVHALTTGSPQHDPPRPARTTTTSPKHETD